MIIDQSPNIKKDEDILDNISSGNENS
ncbi:MAG: hypothetical protein JWP44_1714, partial [Mucilaginibacter sp.]|nr:hypothetical protein [Mucilaginibacter sp.]